MEKMNEIVSVENGIVNTYCSMPCETFEEKQKIFNVINNCGNSLQDHINEEIEIMHIYLDNLTLANEETGEVNECARTILIATDGQAYQAVSIGVFNAVKKLLWLFGQPLNWEKPLRIKVKQISKGANKILTFDLVY